MGDVNYRVKTCLFRILLNDEDMVRGVFNFTARSVDYIFVLCFSPFFSNLNFKIKVLKSGLIGLFRLRRRRVRVWIRFDISKFFRNGLLKKLRTVLWLLL